MEVEAKKIGDLFDRFSSGKNLTDENIHEIGAYPVYGGNGLRGYTDMTNFDGECLIVGRQGAKCGNVRYFSGQGYMTDHAIVGVANKENSTRYLTYALAALNLNRLSGQAAQPGLSVSMLKKQKVLVPSFQVQNKIADVISTYDSLIEINNKRIKILEQMAENLYKEWFVRFRFPGYETVEFENGLPKGWEVKRTDDVIEFNPTVKAGNQIEFRMIPMESLSTNSMLLDESKFEIESAIKGRRSQNGDTLLAKITPCLENGKTGFVAGLEDGESAGGSTEFIVMRSKNLSSYYVYLLARSQYFRKTAILSMNGADGRQRVDERKIMSMKLPVPPMYLIESFDYIVKPIFDEVLQLSKTNHNLIKQRDLLLPRLMSGKLEV